MSAETQMHPEHWADKVDEYSKQIAAAHPMKTGDHNTYALASKMVGNRHSKGALVELVNWLLTMAAGPKLSVPGNYNHPFKNDWLDSKNHCMGDRSDADIADRVRMLMRDDLEHEPVCLAARDRIMHLSERLRLLPSLVEALNGDTPDVLKITVIDLIEGRKSGVQ